MKLGTKVAIMILCMLALVTALAGVSLPAILHQDTLSSVYENSETQLKLIDYSISNLIACSKYHVLELSMNPAVRNPDDSKFTDYLDADPDSFEYNITEDEQEIIDLLHGYRTTHPYINSAYMGRENGAFVRSHNRTPTKYDPRKRSWYNLAKENPDSVMVTEPYSALTTMDLNIGVVKALTDENGTVYGVVGADITLQDISEFISGIDPIFGSELLITDREGTIISVNNPSDLFTDVRRVLKDKTTEYMYSEEGSIELDEDYLVYYTSPELGWKIGLLIPNQEISKENNEEIISVFIYVTAGLILLSALLLLFLNRNIISPISDLTDVSRKIAETGDLNQDIDVRGTAEIKTLSLSFKEMVEKLRSEKVKLKHSLENEKKIRSELKSAHDELEEKVRERTAELAEANRNLREIDRTKSLLIASMNHELRTPLNLIIGFTDLILKGHSGSINKEQEKQLDIIASSSGHLLNLINDIIEINRIESGMFEPSVSSFDLVTAINDIADSFEEYADEHNVFLVRDLPDKLEISGDEQRTKQILINLTDNAIKYSDSGPVTITAKKDGDNAVISVKDRGIGISEDKLKDLFIPFVRIPTKDRTAEGTGLGLYLSEKAALSVKGQISVESTPGEGSEFTLVLPLSISGK